jgi:site-specific recombinase XerC
MKNLNYQLKQLCRNNRDGSYGTQTARSRILGLIADQLETLGFRRMNAQSLKPKHIQALIQFWKTAGISAGTQKNRLSAIRWWARKINKTSVVAKDNSQYGIGHRTYIPTQSKAQVLDLNKLAKVNDARVRMSLRLQSEFGLRREEAIKFQPSYAIQDDHIRLKAAWCKGGRARTIHITNDEQRHLLVDVIELAKGGSLIHSLMTYVQQLHRYEGQTLRAGLSKLHGLRHDYAQRRFEEIAGFTCPVNGGPSTQQLTIEQRALNEKARAMISSELGHSREAITAVYLGR